MMIQPQHIFFDLDHTIWDYEANSRETIATLVDEYQKKFGRRIEFEALFPVYSAHNATHWDLYRKNEIDSNTLRIRRWELTFSEFGIPRADWMENFSTDFIQFCPMKTQLMPEAEAVLDVLVANYPLHLITNGLLDVQKIKIAQSGLDRYFKTMTTPECSGVKKPHPKIFLDALEKAQCAPENALYIGDSYAEDVEGGHEVGMKVLFFNPEAKAHPGIHPEIKSLSQILPMLGLNQF